MSLPIRLAAVISVATALGVVVAWATDVQVPLLNGGSGGGTAGALEVVDAAVESPKVLEDLGETPFHFAVDGKGDVWFATFPASATPEDPLASVAPVLHRFQAPAGPRSTFPLPVGGGTGLFSDIAVDQRGHVIVGYGVTIIDFDAATSTFTEHKLPAEPANFMKNSSEPGTAITSFAVHPSGELFIGRMNAASITALDLTTGKIEERPIAASFGPPIDMVATDDGVYMTNWYGFGGQPQTARFEPDSGALVQIPATTARLAAGSVGDVYATSLKTPPGIVRLDAVAPLTLPSPDLSSHLGGAADNLAVDAERGYVWFAGQGAASIGRYRLSDNTVKVYDLPRAKIPGSLIFCPPPGPCPDFVEVRADVGALAIAPNGDLYFSDRSMNRIGVIRAE